MNLYILLAQKQQHTHTHTHTPLTIEQEIHVSNLNVSNETRMEHSRLHSRSPNPNQIFAAY